MRFAPILKRMGLYIVVSVVLNTALYVWFKQDSYTGFRVSEHVHNIERIVNDMVFSPLVFTVSRNKKLLSLVDEFDTDIMLQRYALDRWQYRKDFMFWDVPTHPVLSLLNPAGDCDDYARLAAYVLHRKGYALVYYVVISMPDSGHALAFHYNENAQTGVLVDINGWKETHAIQFTFPTVVTAVLQSYPRTKHLSIRNWNLKNLLYTMEVKQG